MRGCASSSNENLTYQLAPDRAAFDAAELYSKLDVIYVHFLIQEFYPKLDMYRSNNVIMKRALQLEIFVLCLANRAIPLSAYIFDSHQYMFLRLSTRHCIVNFQTE